MKKGNRNKVFIVVISTLIVLSFLIYSSIPGSALNSVTSPISFITDPLQSIITKSTGNVTGFFKYLSNSEGMRNENSSLKDENAKLKQRIKELEENGRRWNELKSAFKIKDIFSDYELLGASILTREIGDWFDVFRINIGIREKIVVDEKTSYAVVDAQMNLVGRVLSSDLTSSKILPILNEGSIVSGKMNTVGGSAVRVRGDITLKDKGFCLVDKISDFASIKIGDEVITSGLGGLFPPGIPVGTIVEIRNEGQKVEKSAVLKVYANYKTLTDVFIMKGKLAQ
ncbi:MAG: rod shape-determining protein MreC [Saccharofermentanales bacterium]